jgi:hypothetical protein
MLLTSFQHFTLDVALAANSSASQLAIIKVPIPSLKSLPATLKCPLLYFEFCLTDV